MADWGLFWPDVKALDNRVSAGQTACGRSCPVTPWQPRSGSNPVSPTSIASCGS